MGWNYTLDGAGCSESYSGYGWSEFKRRMIET
jgi:hypothetical protein